MGRKILKKFFLRFFYKMMSFDPKSHFLIILGEKTQMAPQKLKKMGPTIMIMIFF